MGLAVAATVAGTAISAGTAIAGATSGGPSSSSGPAPNVYQPAFQNPIDQQFWQMQQGEQASNPASTLDPYMRKAFSAQVNNPYAQLYQSQAGQASQSANALGLNASGTGMNGLWTANNMIPQAQSIYQMGANNPYRTDAMRGAITAGGMGMDLGNTLYGEAMGLPAQQQSIYGSLPSYGMTALNTAFDPQGALYNQMFQQNTDQTRAGLAARGLDMSGVGQGIENQSNQNFNINWQNQQLQRQAQGLSAYEGAAAPSWSSYTGALGTQASIGGQGVQDYYKGSQLPYQTMMDQASGLAALYGQTAQGAQQYGALGTGAYNLGSAGAQGQLAAGAMPYSTYGTIAQDPWSAINNYQGAYGTAQNQYQQTIGNALQYMNLGPSAGQAGINAFNANNAYQQQQFAGLGKLAQAIPGYAQQIGSAFGGGNSAPSYASLPPGYFASGYNPSSFDYTAGGGDLMAA